MVFVHSRKETLTTAETLIEMAKYFNEIEKFIPSKKVDKSIQSFKNKNLKQIVPFGIGIHNAGMLRKDRNIIEKLFLDGTIRVLVTTATLAWGVNLPAYAVIIKGTNIYGL